MRKILQLFNLVWQKVCPPQASLVYKVLLVAAVALGLFVVVLASWLLVSSVTGQTASPEDPVGQNFQQQEQGSRGGNGGQEQNGDEDGEEGDEDEGDSEEGGDQNGPQSGGNGGGPSGGPDGSGDGNNGNGNGNGNNNGDDNGGNPPPPQSSCALPDYPNASCTGVPGGTSLTTHSGNYTASGGEVIEGKRITGNVSITGNNVTIRNSEIYGEIKNPSMAGSYSFTVSDSTIGAPSGGCNAEAAFGHNNFTLERVHMRNFGEGPRIERGGNVVIRDSYFKLCDPGGEAHSDGIQGYLGGNGVVIEHNTIDQRDVSLDTVTANIFWSDSGNNLQFKNNMLAGGGYTIRIHDGSGHMVTGNKVVNNSWYYGPVSSSCGVISWSDNHLVNINTNYQITGTVSTLACAE